MNKSTLISGATIFNGSTWLENHCLVLSDNCIESVTSAQPITIECDQHLNYSDMLIAPGFIDTQVNGGANILFNDLPSLSSLETLSKTHSQFGTCGFLPTLITDDWEIVELACATVERAIQLNIPGVLGIHLEGPFLNPMRKGVHAESKMRRLDQAALQKIPSLAQGKMLITLAPEMCDPHIIRELVGKNIIVAAGHTAANYQQIKAALDEGLSSFTHLFNAMTPLNSREPGVVGAALEDKNSWCSLIVDGFHVHPSTLKIACAAKPQEKLVLVTDAMPSVGSKHKNFKLYDEEIIYKDGKLTNSAGALAGSDLTMLDAVKNTTQLLELPLEQALRMASTNPAAMLSLGHKYGKIEPGFNASFVVLNKNLEIYTTWIDGKIAHNL